MGGSHSGTRENIRFLFFFFPGFLLGCREEGGDEEGRFFGAGEKANGRENVERLSN